MDKVLCPDHFDGTPDNPSVVKDFQHWLTTFESYLEVLPELHLNKLKVLTNFVSPQVYDCFSECITYNLARTVLTETFVKPVNEVFA